MGAVVAAFGKNYPADPRSGAGIKVTTTLGLTWKAQLDFTNIAYSQVAPTTGLLVAQDPISGALISFDIAALPVSPQFVTSLLTGPVPEGYPPRRGQFLAALKASGADRVAKARGAVPSDPDDPINQAWGNTLFVSADSLLAQHVKTACNLTTEDLNTILRQARTRSE